MIYKTKIWKIAVLVVLGITFIGTASAVDLRGSNVVMENNADYKLIESITPMRSIYNYTSTQDASKTLSSYELLFKCGSVNLTEGLDYSLSAKTASTTTDKKNTENILVQFYHDPNPAQINELKNIGFAEMDYIPNDAFFASVPIVNITKLANMPFVRVVSQIRPEWKISPSLSEQMVNSLYEEFDVLVITFVDKEYSGLTKLENRAYGATLNYNQVIDLAKDNNIKWIQIKSIDRQMLSESIPLISANDVWVGTGTPTGSGVKVGVIDSGIDPNHDHFSSVTKIYARDWVDGGDPIDDQKNGHGTHVAGIIAGSSTCYGVPLKGVAPDATLIIERIFDKTGAYKGGTHSEIFDEVVNKGASIVSCSWGHDSNMIYDAGDRAVDNYARNHPDVLFVFANGNGPKDNNVSSPAIAKNVVAVGAIQDGSTWGTTPTVDKYGASNVDLISDLNDLDGPADGRIKPDVLAPGEKITSSIPWNSYNTWKGTSMATPHVAGLAALYKELYPAATSNQIKTALIHAAFKLEDKQGQTGYLQGLGKVEALNTLYNMSYESKNEHFYGTVGEFPLYPTEQTFTVDVPPDAKKLVVTMCYMDRAGSESVSLALVNNLDLSIVSPSGLEFVDWSSVDNVEKIILLEGVLQTGTWTIKVKATDIPGIVEVCQGYDGYVSVITEDPILDVDVPSSVITNVNEDFTLNITAFASGKLVSGVYVTVESQNSDMIQTGGSSGYILGDMKGETETVSPTFKSSKTGTFMDVITVNMGSTDAGIQTKKVTVEVTGGDGCGTLVNGTISTDTTWTVAGSPYIVDGDVTVYGTDGPDSITTLTIEPGVTVKFDKSMDLTIGSVSSSQPGALIANGSPSNKITFTSSNVTPTAGDWGRIYFSSFSDDATSLLNNCVIEYGGSGSGNVYCYQASPTISNCTIRSSSSNGIYCFSGLPSVTGCTMTGNQASGVYAVSSSYPIISGNTISNSGSYPIRISADAAKGVSRNSCSSNNKTGVEIYGGTVSHDGTWSKQDYVITSDVTVKGKDGPDSITTLTIEPGVTMKFDKSMDLTIGSGSSSQPGALIANGSPSNKITFTSSNVTPTAGDWGRIYFSSFSDDATSLLNNCVIEYGGSGYGNVYCYQASPTISNCTIRNSSSNGIYCFSGSPYVTGCTMTGNQMSGIYVTGTSTPCIRYTNMYNNSACNVYNAQSSDITAPNNWWGTTDTDAINNSIYDHYDISYYGIVYYNPYLNAHAGTNDTTPPTLIITSPAPNTTIYTYTITITGTAYDTSGIASVTVNDALASGTGDWSIWSAEVTLTGGVNTITAIVIDNAGNQNSTTITVYLAGTSTLSVGSANAPTNSTITVPVSIENVENISGISFDMLYNSSVVTVSSVSANESFVGSSIIQNIDNVNGTTRVALTNSNLISASAETPVIDIAFNITGGSGSSTSLNMQNVKFNDSESNPYTPAVVVDGQITVGIKGDFNGNGRVDIGDVAKVAFMVAGKVPEDLNADFNGNGRVDIGDAAKIAFFLAGKVSEL